jgi:hypothetical protein
MKLAHEITGNDGCNHSFFALSMHERYPVKVDGQWREAKINIASEREVKRLAYWRIPRPLPEDAAMTQKIFDAVEFARLASNRWQYYHGQHSTVSSLDGLRQAVHERPRAEVAMVLIARPTWDSPIPTLGLSYLRRTWCNHLFLEFFATHPQVIVRRREQIGGVGAAMLHQIVALAERLSAPCIWGEATENSCEWYQNHLAIQEVRDHFFIEDDVMAHCRGEMGRAQSEMLARRTTT